MRTTNDIWYRGMTRDTTMKRLVSNSFNEGGPRISPDGHWVAFTSDESGFNQVYVTTVPGPGGRYQVTQDGGTMPVWSRDGRQLFYGHAQRLESATLSFEPTFSVTGRDTALNIALSSAPGHANYDVAPDGKHFVILKQSGGDPQLIVVHDWKYELRAKLGRVAR
jgi:Tol biopolymer transport system component